MRWPSLQEISYFIDYHTRVWNDMTRLRSKRHIPALAPPREEIMYFFFVVDLSIVAFCVVIVLCYGPRLLSNWSSHVFFFLMHSSLLNGRRLRFDG